MTLHFKQIGIENYQNSIKAELYAGKVRRK